MISAQRETLPNLPLIPAASKINALIGAESVRSERNEGEREKKKRKKRGGGEGVGDVGGWEGGGVSISNVHSCLRKNTDKTRNEP